MKNNYSEIGHEVQSINPNHGIQSREVQHFTDLVAKEIARRVLQTAKGGGDFDDSLYCIIEDAMFYGMGKGALLQAEK